MKNLTRSLLTALFTVGIASTALFASEASRARAKAATPAAAAGAAAQAAAQGTKDNPGFDIINRTSGPITIRVVNGDTASLGKAVVKPAKTLLGVTTTANNESAQIDINKPTLLIVWDKAISNPANEIFSGSSSTQGIGTADFFGNWTIMPKPSYIYHFKPGKSIYVSLEKGGELRPQEGKAKGLLGKTQAGYPLANVVPKADIFRYQG